MFWIAFSFPILTPINIVNLHPNLPLLNLLNNQHPLLRNSLPQPSQLLHPPPLRNQKRQNHNSPHGRNQQQYKITRGRSPHRFLHNSQLWNFPPMFLSLSPQCPTPFSKNRKNHPSNPLPLQNLSWSPHLQRWCLLILPPPHCLHLH